MLFKNTSLGRLSLPPFCTVREISSSDKRFENHWLELPIRRHKDTCGEHSHPVTQGPRSLCLCPCSFSCIPNPLSQAHALFCVWKESHSLEVHLARPIGNQHMVCLFPAFINLLVCSLCILLSRISYGEGTFVT